MDALIPYLSGALGLGLLIGGVIFTGRKVRGAEYKAMKAEVEAYDRRLAGARRTIDALYAYIHALRRWLFTRYPDAELPDRLVDVPGDESRTP